MDENSIQEQLEDRLVIEELREALMTALHTFDFIEHVANQCANAGVMPPGTVLRAIRPAQVRARSALGAYDERREDGR